MSSEEFPPVPSRPHRHTDSPSPIHIAPARPDSKESLPISTSPALPQVPTKRPTRVRTTDLNDLLQSQESLLQEEKQRLLRRKELELEKRKMQHADRDDELEMLERRREELIREKEREREEQLRRQAELEAERGELEQLEKEQQMAMERLVKLEEAKRKLEEKKKSDIRSKKDDGDSTDNVLLKKAEEDFHTKAEVGVQEPEIPRRPEKSKKSQTQHIDRQPVIPERRPESIGRRSTEPVLGIERRPENLGKLQLSEKNINVLEEKTMTSSSMEQSEEKPESEPYSKEEDHSIPLVPDKAPESSRKEEPSSGSSLVEKEHESRDEDASIDIPVVPEQRPEYIQKKLSKTEPPIEKNTSNKSSLLEDRKSSQKSSSEPRAVLENNHSPLEKEAQNLEEKSSHDRLVIAEKKSASDDEESKHETLANKLPSSSEAGKGDKIQYDSELPSKSEPCGSDDEEGSKTIKQNSNEKFETEKQASDGLEDASSAATEGRPTEEPTISNKEHEKPEVIKKNIERSSSDVSGSSHEGKPGDPNGEQGEQSKRKAPPVPKKKPSSRIAAFQEMLRKQQLADAMHGSRDEADSTCEAQNNKHGETEESSQPSIPQRPARHPINAERSKFANDLSGIFALPGMSPMGGLPPSFAKKLGPTTTPGQEEKKESSTSSSGTDVRSSRARGPRGRKLPSKVASVEKVNSENRTNQIQIFKTWKTVAYKREERVIAEGEVNIPVAVTNPSHFDLDEDKAAKPFEDKEDHTNGNDHDYLAPSTNGPSLSAMEGMNEGELQESSTGQESSHLENTQHEESSIAGKSTKEQQEKQHEQQQSEKQPLIPERPTRHIKHLEKVEKISKPEHLPEQYEKSEYEAKLNFSDDLPEATEPMPETTFSFGDSGTENNSTK